jgi:short-subunit dehydrogenase
LTTTTTIMQRANTTESLRTPGASIATLNLNKPPRPGMERAPTSTNLTRPLPIQRLEGKVVMITGGGGKVGVESAGRLLIEGCNVALIDIDQGALEAAVPVLKAAIPTGSPIESRLLTIVADATKEPDVEACAKKVVQRFERLDAALLNCCHRGESKSIFDVTEDDFDRIMTINAKSGMSLPCLFDNVTLR